jgi:hypothetical protein
MWRIRQSTTALVLLLSVVLASCSHSKTINRDDARSEIKAAVSLVAESTLFVDYIHEGRSTRHYAEGHAAYLEDAIQQSLDKLERAEPEPGTATAVHECRAQLELLDRELSGIPEKFGHDEALAAAKVRMTSIRASLEKAGSSL